MTALRIRAGTPDDRAAVTGLLSGLSPDSTYLRFQTSLGSGPRPAVLDALLPRRPGAGALLGFVGRSLAAHGLWVRLGVAPVAEIAIVVADAHQRRGIGTALARALTAELAARGIERVEVFSAAGNVAVARMVARQAPGAERLRDGSTVTYCFPTPSVGSVSVA